MQNKVKQMDIHQIEQKFLTVTAEKERNEETLVTLRSQRASLFLEDSSGYSQEIDKLDVEIVEIQKSIDNFPAVIEELERQLAAEQERLAQEQRAKLQEQQREAADEVQVLSKNFISLLSKANDVNIILRNALVAEQGLRQKTGQVVLESWCDGSADYLRVLLETMQLQMDGIHTQPVGAGIIGAGVELRI